MSLTLASLLMFAAAEGDVPTPGRVPAEEAVRRLEGCGLVKVVARYEELIEADVARVEDPAGTDTALACAADVSVATGYWIEVPEASRTTYFAHYTTVLRERSRERALARLAERGLLDSVPVYRAGETDDHAFAVRIEELCGATARGALQSESGPHAISPEWALRADGTFEQSNEAIVCLITYAAAAGYELGFTGNGKASDPR